MRNLEEKLKSLSLDLGAFKILSLGKLTKKKSYRCAFNDDSLAFVYEAKTRFLSRDALFLEDLLDKVFKKNLLSQDKITQKYFIHEAALCSKARKLLEDRGFRVYALV